ncbi:MAG: hypothetical protein V3W52_17290 [Syntrophobacteria bacterium]
MNEQLDNEVKRKAEADRITNSWLHKEAWNVLEMHLFDQFSKTKDNDADVRESLYREMKALTRVKKYYESIITTGKMAEHQLSTLEKAARKVKKVINM